MNIRTLILAVAAAIGEAAISQANGTPAVNAFTHIVVIYQENHSFDNLYGLWGKVNGSSVNSLESADPPHTVQVRADDKETPYSCLLQTDVNLTSPPLPATCTDDTGAKFQSAFANAPYKVDSYISANDTTCPLPAAEKSASNGTLKGSGRAGGCTRDLIHGF